MFLKDFFFFFFIRIQTKNQKSGEQNYFNETKIENTQNITHKTDA